MSIPTIRANAGIYDLLWENEQVAIRIDRIRESHEHVTCEIVVKTLRPGTPQHLHQARLTLTSTTARQTLVKQLCQRSDEDIWMDIVEQACVEVLAAYRKGEPVVELHEAKSREGPRFRLSPLLLDGHPNYIYGDGSTGKSYLATYFAVLISSGFHKCGLDPLPANILYLDYEMSEDLMKERMLAIEQGLGEGDCSSIQYRFCVQPLANEIEAIQAIVAEKEIEFVVVDSAGPALGGERGDPKDPVIEYFRALRSLRCGSLTTDHITKDNTSRKPYGSVYKFNLARNVYELRKEQGEDERSIQVGLYHRKNNFGRLLPSRGFNLDFTDTATTFSSCNVRDIPALAEGMSVPKRIEGLLLGSIQGFTVKDISEQLEIPEPHIRTALSRGDGTLFTKLDKGRYGALARDTS